VIPRASLTAWRRHAPWAEDWQVEQDLIISRALVDIFSRTTVAARAAFRGGTALHKLCFDPPARYSDDIDLVQRDASPIGPLVDEIRHALDSWLGTPKWKTAGDGFTLYYRFETTLAPVIRARLKLEINTREHFAVHGLVTRSFGLANAWFSGTARIPTHTLPELLGTKLRALYQRKKGRDLFDLDLALEHPELDLDLLLEAFERYMLQSGTPVTRAQFEANLAAKIADPSFVTDVQPLLRTDVEHDPGAAWSRVHAAIVSRLPGGRGREVAVLPEEANASSRPPGQPGAASRRRFRPSR
jgi:predicted nucleotidyltransferase component of viral defense system